MELQKRLDFLFRHLDVKYVPELSEEDRVIADALKTGGVLEAIKVYRGIHKVDLDSAKQAVEAIKGKIGLR
jgi:ribosomal protein L7/L12